MKRDRSTIFSILFLVILFVFSSLSAYADSPGGPQLVTGPSGNSKDALYGHGFPLLIEAGTNHSKVSYDSNGDGTYDKVFEDDIDLSNIDVFGGSPDGDCTSTSIRMTGGEVHYIIGGGHKSGNISGDVNIDIEGGRIRTICGGFYSNSSSSSGKVDGQVIINISGGEIYSSESEDGITAGGWAWGSGARSVVNKATVNISGGIVKRNIAAGWANSGGSSTTDSLTVNISGGTVDDIRGALGNNQNELGNFAINISGGMVNGTINPSQGLKNALDSSELTITGGSVKGSISNIAPNNGSLGVYKTTLRFIDGVSEVKNSQVTSLTISDGYNYQLKDVETDNSGKIYVYLPEGALVTRGVIGGETFYSIGGILTQSDGGANGDLIKALPPAELIGGGIYRPNDSEVSVRFRSDKAGQYYYQISDDSQAPAISDVNWLGSSNSVVADTSTKIEITDFPAGDKYIHVYLKNDDGIASEPISFFIPAGFYYEENFESYSDGAYPDNFAIKYNGAGNDQQKTISEAQKDGNTGKVFRLKGSSGWASDQRIYFSPELSGIVTYEVDIKPVSQPPGGIALGNKDHSPPIWTGGIVRIGLDNNQFFYLTKVENVPIPSSHPYSLNAWYRIKIVLDLDQRIFDFYVDGEKINSEPIESHPDAPLTYLGLYSGNGSGNEIYFDNVRFYSGGIVGLQVDTTPPVLVAGNATRLSSTEASVSFTSDEAGEFFYEITEKGHGQPLIDSSSPGTLCDTSEQTIILTSLNAEAKDIYIIVKDEAGNLSEPLLMEIPAYTTFPILETVATSSDGKKIILTYDKDMVDPAACTNNFIVKVNGEARNIIQLNLAADPRSIELTLDIAVKHGQAISISHPPNGGCIKASDGTIPLSFEDRTVTNKVPGATPPPSSGSDSDDSPSPAPAQPQYEADLKTEDDSERALPVTVDQETGQALADVDKGKSSEGNVSLIMPSVPDVNTYSIGIPVPDLSTEEVKGNLTIETDKGHITLPSNMLTGLTGIEGEKAQVSIGQGDKEALPEEIKTAIGERPLIKLSLSIDGREASWDNPQAPVQLSIPYRPEADELLNPEAIVIWYIDGAGNVVTIPNGSYDEKRGRVTFQTSHFSNFAVTYKKVDFVDVLAGDWHEKAVSFIAARDITKGTSQTEFSPNRNISRAELMVMLMKAYEIKIDEGAKDDFEPEEKVSRQEMFALVYRTLNQMKKVPLADSDKSLKDFTDVDSLALGAREDLESLVRSGIVAGFDGKLMLEKLSSRAEMAALLYKLLSK